MKKDIHPEYVDTQVTCTCGNTFTTRSTADQRLHPRRRVLAVPPVLHRQAEDPRHRRPRRPLRGPLRQEGRRPRSSSTSGAGPRSRAGDRRRVVVSSSATGRARRSAPMFEAVDGLVAEHARARGPAGRPRERTPTSGWPSGSTSGTPSCRPSCAPSGSGSELGDDIEAARELAGEDASFAEEADDPRRAADRRPRSTCATCWCRATPPTPRTRCSR